MAKKIWSIVNQVLGILILCVFIFYFGTSIAALVFNLDSLRWYGLLLNILVLIFEMIGPIYVIYFLVQLIDGILKTYHVEYDLEKLDSTPRVAVLVPVHNAHPKILEKMFKSLQNLTYPNLEFWIGDDNSDKEYSEEYELLANEYNVNYHYGEKHTFKAGILNQVIPKTESDYIVFFDVDQTPEPDIIKKFVAVLQQNPKYGFVQAKFDFKEAKSLLHTWEMISYYQLSCAQSGKMRLDYVIFHGCNACFRREHAYPLPENKLSEDYDHTINLLSEGVSGCWLGDIGASNIPTDTFDHKMSQMFRWTTGQVGAVMDHWKKYFKSKISFKQAIDLFISSTLTLVLSSLYLVGILYALIYALKVPIFRAYIPLPSGSYVVLGDIAMIIVPILIGVVYCAMITATTVYSIRTSTYKINFFEILFFLLYSALIAPILLIPTVGGIFRQNKLIPGKTKWNKKIPLYLISSIMSFFGLIYCALTTMTILDFLKVIDYYPEENYFFLMFLVIAFMLTLSLPFVAFAKARYKPTKYFKDKNVYS